MNKMRKLLSFLLAFSMVLSYVPMPGLAEEVCTHHIHDEACGYSEGAACAFDHAANCRYETVVVNCAHIHGEGGCTYVAAKEAVNCHPEHMESCGYVPAVDCTCGVTEGEHLEDCAYQEEGSCNVIHEGCACADAVPESGECNHSCSTETGCEVTENHICVHTACDETCGFKAAADCTFACEECKAEKEVEPQPEPAVLTVTAWSWVDDYEIIDTDYMDAVIPGVGAENPIDWETLVELLPASITAVVDGEGAEIPVTWECETFPEAATGGKYTLKAILPEGYALGEEVIALELEVDLGTVQQLYNLQGDGSASNPYLIYNSEDLHEFAWRVNNNGSSDNVNKRQSSACAKLMNSIAYYYDKDSNGADAWYAIGSEKYPYTGTFDGQGYTISGLSLTGTEGQNSFIRYLGTGGTIKNLTINGTFSGSSNIGGIAGQNRGTISNCTFTGSVTGTAYNAGSIVGKNFGTITGCRNNGTVSGNENTGGIVGLNESGGPVDQCINNGSVSGRQYVGGIAGTNKSTIENCHNAGSVSASTKIAGGIVGVNNGTVAGCLNTASVSSTTGNGGGLIGENKSGALVHYSCFKTEDSSAPTVGTNSGGTQEKTSKFTSNAFQTNQDAIVKRLNRDQNAGVWAAGTTYPVLDGGSSPNPGIITITGQPNTTILTYKEYGTATFGVMAKVSNSSALTYQWYRCDDSKKTNAQPAEGGIGKNFTIPLGLEPGKYYYYCTVSAEGAESVDTDVVYAHVKVPHQIILTASEGGSVVAKKFKGQTPLKSSVSGTQIFLEPTANEGYEFKEWKIISGGVSINSGNNSFYMPDTDVKIEAVFEKVPTTCRINIDNTITNGTVTADKTDALENESITLTVAPGEGYKLKSLTVDSTDVTTEVKNNRYTFLMPAKDVTVSATFQVIKYPVKVQNVEVTALNKSDVLKDGTVSYDPATFTLSLNNADISYGSGAAIHSTYPDYTLTIVGTGTNRISSTGGSGIYVSKQNISISGGTFLISGSTNGIFAENGTLTVDGAQVKAVGTNKGVYAKNGITVTNGGGLLAVTGNAAVVRGIYTMGKECFAKLSVTEDAKLIIESGETVTVSEKITSSGKIEIRGTLKVPEGSGRNTMSGGTLYIGTKGYQWDAEKKTYVCLAHDWNYTASGATITADCDSCDTVGGTVTLSATGGVYSGSAYKASLNISEDWKGAAVSDDSIVYQYRKTQNESYSNAAEQKNAGFYEASITVNDVVASVTYEVTPKALQIRDITATDRDYVPGNTEVSISAVTFDGTANDDVLTVTATGTLADATAGTDKPVSVTIALSGDAVDNYSYPTTATTTVTIRPRSLNADGVTAVLSDNLIFAGAEIPSLTVKDGSITLTKDTDYTVTQTESEGLCTLSVVGKGNYQDSYSGSLTYLVVTLPDPDKVQPDDKDTIDAYDRYLELNKTYKDPELAEKLEQLQKALTDYDVIKGHKSSYTKGSGKTFTITANGYVGKFTGLKVDGKLLDTSCYTVKSGSTVVTFKNSYLNGLSDGKHTVEFLYTDGTTGGDHYFRIASNNGSPFTGDNSHMMLFSGIMMISLLCMAMTVMFAPRKKGKFQR